MIPFDYVEDATIRRNFDLINQLLGSVSEIPHFLGSGSPETVVTASPPAIYFDYTGGAGTTLYIKESGVATNTGWIAK